MYKNIWKEKWFELTNGSTRFPITSLFIFANTSKSSWFVDTVCIDMTVIVTSEAFVNI